MNIKPTKKVKIAMLSSIVVMSLLSAIWAVSSNYSFDIRNRASDPTSDDGPSETSFSSSGRISEISVINDYEEFYIQSPDVGVSVDECTLGSGDNLSSSTLRLQQWSNTKSWCNGSHSDICPNATSSKATGTGAVCFDKDAQSFTLYNYAIGQPDKGCNLHSNQINMQNPGGYANFLYWDTTKLVDYSYASPKYNLTLLDSLIVEFDFSTSHYTSQGCDGVVDPRIGDSPVAIAEFAVVVNEIQYDDATIIDSQYAALSTMFYEVILYDNRRGQLEPDNVHIDCSFPNSSQNTIILIGEPITSHFMSPALPDSREDVIRYSVNVLPRIKKYLRVCRGNTAFSENSKSSFYLAGIFWGNELNNATSLQNTVIDPKVKLVSTVARTTDDADINQYRGPLFEIICDKGNGNGLDHIYTMSGEQYETYVRAGCDGGGVLGYLYPDGHGFPGTMPIYHTHSSHWDDHFYTSSSAEIENAISNGWGPYEVIGYIGNDSAQAGTAPLYRLLEPRGHNVPLDQVQGVDRKLTTSENVRDYLVSLGYLNEGIIGYIFVD